MSPLAALMKSKAQELKQKGTMAVYLREMKSDLADSDSNLNTSDIVTDIIIKEENLSLFLPVQRHC